MLQKPIIRSLSSVLLLLTFAFGVTPKIALHDLVAHHKDTRTHAPDGKAAQLNTAGFHCGCDNQVVESSFLDYSFSIRLDVPVAHSIHLTPAYEAFHSATPFIFGLRGPPSSVSST